MNQSAEELSLENSNQMSPMDFKIESAYPNPFNNTIKIDYSLEKRGMWILKFLIQMVNGLKTSLEVLCLEESMLLYGVVMMIMATLSVLVLI